VAEDYRARQRKALETALDLLAEQYAVALRDSALKDGAARVQADQQAAEIDGHGFPPFLYYTLTENTGS